MNIARLAFFGQAPHTAGPSNCELRALAARGKMVFCAVTASRCAAPWSQPYRPWNVPRCAELARLPAPSARLINGMNPPLASVFMGTLERTDPGLVECFFVLCEWLLRVGCCQSLRRLSRAIRWLSVVRLHAVTGQPHWQSPVTGMAICRNVCCLQG